MPMASPAMTIAVTPSLLVRGTSSASSSYDTIPYTRYPSVIQELRVNIPDTAHPNGKNYIQWAEDMPIHDVHNGQIISPFHDV